MSKIKEYPKSVKVLRRLIKRHGALSAQKFDELFGDKIIIVSDGVTKIGGEIYPQGAVVHQRKPFRYRLINRELNKM